MKYRTKLLLVAVIGGAISLALFVRSFQTGGTPLQELQRPQSGEGSREESLQVELEGKKYAVNVMLLELPWEESALGLRLSEACEGLESIFLNGNADLDHIVSDVYMPSEFPDSHVEIQWYLDSWKYVQPDGTVKNESLEEDETIPLEIQAILTLGGESLTWERTALICPVQEPSVEQKLEFLRDQTEEAQTGNADAAVLPGDVYGESVIWYPAADRRWLQTAALTILALLAMVLGRKNEETKEKEQRERELQLAYPEIVSRLSLYMGAGVSTRGAWERVVNGGGTGAVYREMSTTLHEMQSGVPEALAYERFGNRCQLPAYLKLGTLLSQNLRKGTKNLAALLREEAEDAFEDRKALARKLGEECESKLLFPMLLLLLTVLIMVMYPAVASFQG